MTKQGPPKVANANEFDEEMRLLRETIDNYLLTPEDLSLLLSVVGKLAGYGVTPEDIVLTLVTRYKTVVPELAVLAEELRQANPERYCREANADV